MPAVVSNTATENCLRALLERRGYRLNPKRAYGETGADIIASNDKEYLHIEVIGYKSSGPARAKAFYESFFRAVSRLKDGASRCVIAIPILAKQGLPARARQHGEAWIRNGQAFPELEIWLVDTENQLYKWSLWNDWLTNKST
jgi:hypothetical protein